MQEMWVRPLGQEDPLEEGMATHCSILACAIPWTEEPGGLQSLSWEGPLEEEMATDSCILAGESHGQRSLADSVVSHRITWD